MRARLGGVELTWQESGGGPDTLLLVHGFPFSSELWSAQLAAPPPGWRVVAPDLRGFGRSGLGSETVHTMEVFAADLLALLDHLAVERAVVGGLSMGGYIAFALHALALERLRGIALVDTRAGADDEATRRARRDLAARVRKEGTALYIEEQLARLLSPRTLRERREIVDRLRRIMRSASVEGVARAAVGMARRPDSTPRLASMDVPALVMVGADDAVTPPSMARAMADALPGARLEVLPGAGHASCMEDPDAFNGALRRFLDPLGGS